MKSLTLRLPETLIASIEMEAHAYQTTKSEVVRRRLEEAPAISPGSDTWAAAKAILEKAWKSRTPARRTAYRNPHKQRTLEAMRGEKQRSR